MELEAPRARWDIMHRVIYVSCSLVGNQPDTLQHIVEHAAARNLVEGVTGMLWSDGEHFVQALEGDEEVVSATMRRILADPRHTSIEIAEARAIQAPRFGAWSMIEAGESALAQECGVFLVGMAGMAASPANKRIREVMLRSLV